MSELKAELVSGPPTQVQYPWRSTVRTVFAAVVGLLSLLPVIAATAGIDAVPAVAQILVVTGAITRVLALPGVNEWLQKNVGWLAAEPKPQPDVPAIIDKALGK
mgnify:CR=1 FL=1